MVLRVILILAVAILSSCITPKKIQKNCYKWAKICPVETVIKDSLVYRDTIIYRDTTIYVPLPNDTVIIERKIRVRGGKIISDIDTITKESGVIGVKAWLIDSKLGAIGYVADSGIYYVLNDILVEKNHYEEKYNEIKETKVTVEEVKVGKFYVWFFWIVIVIAIVIGYIGLRCYLKRK